MPYSARRPTARRGDMFRTRLLCSLALMLDAGRPRRWPWSRRDPTIRCSRRSSAIQTSTSPTCTGRSGRPAWPLPSPRRQVTALTAELAALGVGLEHGFYDTRGGAWGSLTLARPLIPGPGVGNTLQWSDLGRQAAGGQRRAESGRLDRVPGLPHPAPGAAQGRARRARGPQRLGHRRRRDRADQRQAPDRRRFRCATATSWASSTAATWCSTARATGVR